MLYQLIYFNYLNSLSSNSTLSVDNLNATLKNIFSISLAYPLSVKNINATSTTILII